MIKLIKANKSIACFKQENKYGYDTKYLHSFYTDIINGRNSYEYFGIRETPVYDFFVSEEKVLRAKEFFGLKSDIKKIIFNAEGAGKKSLTSEKIKESLLALLGSDKNYNIYDIHAGHSLKI